MNGAHCHHCGKPVTREQQDLNNARPMHWQCALLALALRPKRAPEHQYVMNDDLHIWTVYDHPSDYPHSFVARLFVVRAGREYATNQVFEADTLDALRAKLPQGLYRMPREPHDDAPIVETWL